MKEYENLLGQILKGEQPLLKDIIEARLEDSGIEFEGDMIYSLESLRIWQAIEFLKENYEEIKDLIV